MIPYLITLLSSLLYFSEEVYVPPAKVKRCCVSSCKNRNSKRHRFPPLKERAVFNAWVNKIKPPNFDVLTAQEIYNKYIVCEEHFTPDCFVPGRRGLVRNAVPSLNLPDHSNMSAVPGPSIVCDNKDSPKFAQGLGETVIQRDDSNMSAVPGPLIVRDNGDSPKLAQTLGETVIQKGKDDNMSAVPGTSITIGETVTIKDSSEAMDSKQKDELLRSRVKDPETEPQGTAKGSDKGTPTNVETRTDLEKRAAEQQRAIAKKRDKRRRQAANKKAKYRATAVSGDPLITPVSENSASGLSGSQEESFKPRGPITGRFEGSAQKAPAMLSSALSGRGVDREDHGYPRTYSRFGRGGSKRPREIETLPGGHHKRKAEERSGRPAHPGTHRSRFLRTDQPPTPQTAEGPIQAAAQPVAKREFQVVFRSSRQGGIVLEEEVETIRRHIVDEMLRAMMGPDGRPSGPELHFWNSGRVDPGWFLISAQGDESLRWLIEDCPPPQIGAVRFTAIRSVDAPWPEKIGLWLKGPEVDLKRLTSVLELQNRTFQVGGWKHMETTGGPGNWFVVFIVGRDVVERLEASGWTLFYELVTLSARRVTSRSSTARQNIPLAAAPPRK